MQKYIFDKENIPVPEEYFSKNQSSRCKYCNYQALLEDIIQYLKRNQKRFGYDLKLRIGVEVL